MAINTAKQGMTEEELRGAYALMEQRLADQARELATLLSVQQAITSRLDRQEVLQMIADGARQLISSLHAGVYLLDGDMLRLAVLSLDPTVVRQTTISAGYSIPLSQSVGRIAIETGKPILIPDVHNDPRVYQAVLLRTHIRSYLAVPLMAGGQPIGLLFASDKLNGTLTSNDERILTLLASSAVIGLENARLYEHAEETAALAERSRLARELHDAVTQTLFSASLIAEVLPQIWEIDPEEGRRRLEELRQSTRGALAEMRTLLLELRPSALLEADTSDLFKHLANAFTGRTRVPVNFQYNGLCPLPGEIKLAFYRIAQEALNNIARHADANLVKVNLSCQPGLVELEIRDDGVGFEPSEISAEHLGVKIMKERAEAIDAELSIQSSLGQGTTVSAHWKPKK
jgi:signal transduction histidine kinase